MNGTTDQFCSNFTDGGYMEAAFVAEKVTESPKWRVFSELFLLTPNK